MQLKKHRIFGCAACHGIMWHFSIGGFIDTCKCG